MTAEQKRLLENEQDPKKPWYRWGPYVSERQWGTVREDYGVDGNSWLAFPHEHARFRAYRWGEDGIGGFSDRHGLLNFTVALWNFKDPILKERLFGLTNPEGNHGEDVKEAYHYLDATPTHSYLKMAYRYPHNEFPYEDIVETNRKKGRTGEYEIFDAGVFDDNAFFDVTVEFAKRSPDDVLWRLTITNCGSQPKAFAIIPQITCGAKWEFQAEPRKPELRLAEPNRIEICTDRYGVRHLYFQEGEPLFTDNVTNAKHLFGVESESEYTKDAFHRLVINQELTAVNPSQTGTKCGLLTTGTLAPGESRVLRLRFVNEQVTRPFDHFDETIASAICEADEFYEVAAAADSEERKRIQRQAFAGLIWTKQYYHFDHDRWKHGDPGKVPPPSGRFERNKGWDHMHTGEVLSMPDKWEYPWFAAWDTAFHMVPFALIDSKFAKDQLLLFLREWYMHPNGQIPAYEWNFSDVNPPVHAWSVYRVYQIEKRQRGVGDVAFLEQAFHKLLMNFTWWVNRKDEEGNNVFEGGFLGLDNIGVFDRNTVLPNGITLEQSDGTSWMAMYCLNMLNIAVELSKHNASYQEIASKFFEHFVYIAEAIDDGGIWNEDDGFYYDVLKFPGASPVPIKVKSLVGLIPLFAVSVLETEDLQRMPMFTHRMRWFERNRPHLMERFCSEQISGETERQIFSLVSGDRLKRILSYMLDDGEFLSPYGVRGVTKALDGNPYRLELSGQQHEIVYTPGESMTSMFGGNSNWRGPIWFPINFLIVESLQQHDYFRGREFKVPLGGRQASLWEVSLELSKRLIALFEPNENGKRPAHNSDHFTTDPNWKDWVWFYEYFHGDTGRGLGANHQTGWTGLVAKLIDQVSRY